MSRIQLRLGGGEDIVQERREPRKLATAFLRSLQDMLGEYQFFVTEMANARPAREWVEGQHRCVNPWPCEEHAGCRVLRDQQMAGVKLLEKHRQRLQGLKEMLLAARTDDDMVDDALGQLETVMSLEPR